jgi:hypothetical protein
MKCLAPRSALLAVLVLATSLQLCVSTLEAIKGLHRGGPAVAVCPDKATDDGREQHRPVAEVEKELAMVRKRAAGDPSLDGDHTFDDGYPTALIHYSGGNSTVIFVLTYQTSRGVPTRSNLYRSEDYGATFVNINNRLESSSSVVLSPRFFVSDFNQNLLLFAHATQPRLYYTLDEGDSFMITDITSVNINPRTLLYHPDQDGWMMAQDTSSALYLSRNYGKDWTKVDNSVDSYQWGDPRWDANPLRIYYTTADPNDSGLSGNLFFSEPPYTSHQQFDPTFGAHDAFLVFGPYIFAQRTDAGKINLYVSHLRKAFRLAKIPTPYNHQRYLVSHIDELQAMVIIQHEGGFYNLYLSDSTGMDYSLSLRDIVVVRGILDLELIEGVNGTLIANQYVRDSPSQTNAPKRTLITLDNGGYWELLIPPDVDVDGRSLNCRPPACSLHLHMDSSAYARLGVYSTPSAPGLIIAHGNTNATLLSDPDLFISRDGGVTWEQTLKGSWGVGVADHGGLLVAAKDYHQTDQSSVLWYSCNEGYSWNTFHFSSSSAVIYGVITEPGHHTTVMSLYGQTTRGQWRVFTIDFRAVFERECRDSDYIQWMPWDLRSDTDCILGVTVTIERRRAQTCCLNGRDYDREVSVEICQCNEEDFECDYGYERLSLSGLCVRDPDVDLPDPCAAGQKNYTASSGYRKIAGDLCQGGQESLLNPFTAPCCGDTTLPPTLPTSTSSSSDTPSTGPTSGSTPPSTQAR